MVYVVVLLLAAGATLYALVDAWGRDDDEVRTLPRAGWVLLILLLPGLGAVLYLTGGRGPASPARPLAPDDDPEFLSTLARENRRRSARRPGPGPKKPGPAPDPAAEAPGKAAERRPRRERREPGDVASSDSTGPAGPTTPDET